MRARVVVNRSRCIKRRVVSDEKIKGFRKYLLDEEKSKATIEKYVRDVQSFFRFAKQNPVNKEMVIEYKTSLIEKGYAVSSINSMIASLNSFFRFVNWTDCNLKSIRRQRQTYSTDEKELTKKEYMKLLRTAEEQPQIYMVMKTICGTGIRVSELQYFTVETVMQGEIIIHCKSKTRTILIPEMLRLMLIAYAAKRQIEHGPIFITRNGNTLNRSNIWAKMKQVCRAAGIQPGKVFPHNLRKLFARTFYGMEKDIAQLADILGHSSINTTRIYIMTTGTEHRKKMEKLGLVD